MFFGFLGSLIFSEIITLNFCNLDKDTIDKTNIWSEQEILTINLGNEILIEDTLNDSLINKLYC